MGIVDPALLIPGPEEGLDGGGVKEKEVLEAMDEVGGVTVVGLEEVPEVDDHISDYESDQSDEAMTEAEQQVFVKQPIKSHIHLVRHLSLVNRLYQS